MERSEFDGQERILQRDEDRNGDGIVDLRSFYEEGRLIRRELVEEDSAEQIEEEELASSAWSSGGTVKGAVGRAVDGAVE